MAAYETAIEQGADFIEPDVVITKDGVLVCRHENQISGTTDIATRPEFALRRATRTVEGASVTGWFAEDLTYAELKTLKARERIPSLRKASAAFDGRYEIPTLAEVVALAKMKGVGVYPEAKHPSYLAGLGLPIVKKIIDVIADAGMPRAKVFLQSFERDACAEWKTDGRYPVVFLLDANPGAARWTSTEGLKEMTSFADALGANKSLAMKTALIADAHAAGLKVHLWTFRPEPLFAAKGFAGKPVDEIRRAFALGADGVFCDRPSDGVAARTP